MTTCSSKKWETAEWLAPSCAWLPFSRLCSSCLSSWSCCTWTCSSSHLLLHCCSFCCSSCITCRDQTVSVTCCSEPNWVLSQWVCRWKWVQMFCVETSRRANVDPWDIWIHPTLMSVSKYLHGKMPLKYLQNKDFFVTKSGNLRGLLSLLPQYPFILRK